MNAAAIAAAAKSAGAALKKLLGRELSTAEWRLAGRYDAEPLGGGLYLARIDPDDPLRLEHLPTGQKLVVPFREMETDFASVPRLLQRLTGGSSLLHLQATSYKDAALFHDELYAAAWCWSVKAGRAVRVPVTKRQADAVLFVGLECAGATLADGLAYHGAVALFGGKAWRACRAQSPLWPPMFDRSGLKGSEVEKLKGSEAPAPSTSQPFNLSTGPSASQPFNPSTFQPAKP